MTWYSSIQLCAVAGGARAQMSEASAMSLLKEDMVDVRCVLVLDAVCIEVVVVVAVDVLLLLCMYLEKSCFEVWLKDSLGDE